MSREVILPIIIIYGVLIWTYLNPEKSLWGTRGLYKEEPQLTESAIRNTKAKALISIIVITGMIVFLYLLNS